MKSKNIFKSLLLMLTVATISCEKEYVPLDTVEDVSWYTSETIKQSYEKYTVNADSVISFMDLSQSALSHEWIIEEGSYFQKDNFNMNLHPYIEQIDESKGLVSKKAIEHVCFTKLGETKVTLKNRFANCVTSNTNELISAVEDGDNWLFTKEFIVDVYGKLNPAVQIFKIVGENEPEEVFLFEEDYVVPNDPDQWQSITLTAGDKLRFVDLLGGDRPDSRTWTIGEDTYIDAETDVTFTSPDTYSDFFIQSTRTLPVATYKKRIPINVIVEASTELFVAKEEDVAINTASSNIIYVPAKNGAFLIANGVVEDFSVTVETGEGIAVDGITVTGVQISPSNSAMLEVTLSDVIYPKEKVMLSYTAGENKILSSDGGREFQSFTDIEVINNYEGVSAMPTNTTETTTSADAYGFELAYSGNYWTPSDLNSDLFLAQTDTYHAGTSSLRVQALTATTALKFYMLNEKHRFEVEHGTYLLTHYVYVEKLGDGAAGKNYDFITAKFSAHVNSAGEPQHFQIPSTTGEWVKQEIIVKYDDSSLNNGKTGFRIDFYAGLPEGTTLYIDDINLIKLRP